jgi:hypothetical protein
MVLPAIATLIMPVFGAARYFAIWGAGLHTRMITGVGGPTA